jgi:hypothetical protein
VDKSIKATKLLLVEGRDEENFFKAACTHLGLHDIQVLGVAGKTKLTGELKAIKADPNFPSLDCLAIVRDADITPTGSKVSAVESALQSVCGSLALAGVQLACPPNHGQIVAGPPRVGLFVMPDGKSDGMLESLCISSVSTSAEFACIGRYLACLAQHGIIPSNLDKASARAWLASRADPDKSVGQAALASNDPGNKYWKLADPTFRELWSFLRAM